jgi:hypothetical protein
MEPQALVLPPGAVASLRARVIGHPDKRVTWALPAGSWNADGLFEAPTTPGVYTLEATSVANPAIKATVKVTVADSGPDASLVGRWTFEEGSGTTVPDVSGHGLTATLADPVQWIEGRVGQGLALQFDGYLSTLSIPNTAALNPQSLTFAAWLYLARDPKCSTASNWRNVIHKGSVWGTTSSFDVNLEENGRLNFDTGTGATDRWWPAGAVLPVGQWTHVIFTFDAASGLKQAYLNGVKVDSKLATAAPLASNTSPLVFNNAAASACSSGYGHFDGALDDLRIYNRTLSQAEIEALFAPVVVVPERTSLSPGGSAAFQATVAGGTPSNLTWGASGGTVGTDGTYTAPRAPGVYTLTVAAASAPSKPDVAVLNVRDDDASEAFTKNQNPNGPWSYGWSTSLGGGFTPFTTGTVNNDDLEAWNASGLAALGIYRNAKDRLLPVANRIFYQPGQLAMHPGPAGQVSVLRWTAPAAGSYDVTAAFRALDAQPATTDVHVLHNGVSKFDGTVNATMSGPAYAGTLALQAGDTVDVAVGYGNGSYNYDTTAVSFRINRSVPSIRVAPGQVLLAPGGNRTFTATVSGLPSSEVLWSVEEGSFGGDVTAGGVYTAPGLPGVYHVVATSAADGTVLGKATVVVASAP